jgi:hypothetical protein
MLLNVWTERSGYTFGTFQERIVFDQALPVASITGVSYQVISGKLPAGLRLEGNRIVGNPYEVPRVSTYTFCIRASKKIVNINGTVIRTDFADRTFTITIEGADVPIFQTPAGELVFDNNHMYVVDSTYVDYQIQVTDQDTASGQQLHYFIASGAGQLPPGLILTDDGRIVGFVQPVLSLTPQDGNGTYDNSYYDAGAYDFAFRSTNGYDSYIYDTVFYDYSANNNTPKKINRNYEFIVTVTDGDSISQRKFRIFVVGADYFRADNAVWLDNNGMFTADVSYLQKPIWVTPNNLGLRRANNYITIPFEVYQDQAGLVIITLDTVNADLIASTYQATITDNIIGSTHLTVRSAGIPLFGKYITFAGIVDGEYKTYQISGVAALGDDRYRITLNNTLSVAIPDAVNFSIGSLCTLPPRMTFDTTSSKLYGTVPYQPAITKSFTFTLTANKYGDKGDIVKSSRIFTISLLGEVDSVITWNTGSSLGVINANFISTFSINATTTVPGAIVIYNVTSGRLPPGLTLNLDGEIIGKVTQYATLDGDGNIVIPGLTTFDFAAGSTTFDNATSTIDRVFTFIAEARDQYGYSATSKEFTIRVETPNEMVFSNIRVKPFLKLNQRSVWKNFINNTTVFTPGSIYRPNDINFGIQSELNMLVYAGIETTEAARYISAMGLNHKRKRFQFGSVKKAMAVIPGTKTQVYEVVYIQMIDPLEPNGKRLPNELNALSKSPSTITVDNSLVFWQPGFSHGFDGDGNPLTGAEQTANLAINGAKIDSLALTSPDSVRPDPIISIDSTGYTISDPNPSTYFPSSITNWRDRLKNWTAVIRDPLYPGDPTKKITVNFDSERNYLPLWMRSIQPGTRAELGFQLAVPICYCKVGAADDIILNIKFSKFDFKLLDYTADRYIIDSVAGSTQDKYLVFKNDRITV